MALDGAVKRMPSAEATSPAPQIFDERQRGMGGHDPRTGGRDGFRPDEVLADPGQALPPECWNILPANRLDADIAGFGDQRGAQAGFEMLYPSLPLAEMGEGFGKAGSTSHFGFGVVSGRLRFAGLMVSGAVRPSHRV
jgi:hypothetical protein